MSEPADAVLITANELSTGRGCSDGVEWAMFGSLSSLLKHVLLGFSAAFVASALSLATLSILYPDAWRLSGRYFLVYFALHGILVGVLLTVCMIIDLTLTKPGGILRSVGVSVVGSALVIVLGLLPAFALLSTGLAFLTPFVATFLYAGLRTWLLRHPTGRGTLS